MIDVAGRPGGKDGLERLFYPLPIIRMDSSQKRIQSAAEILRPYSHKPAQLGRGGEVSGLRLPFPIADFRDPLRQAQPRLAPEQRIALYWKGEIPYSVCFIWASRFPREVPLLNGEYHWIAITLE